MVVAVKGRARTCSLKARDRQLRVLVGQVGCELVQP
jgi:hypothetical protein